MRRRALAENQLILLNAETPTRYHDRSLPRKVKRIDRERSPAGAVFVAGIVADGLHESDIE
jgi:hypothetical protein